MSKVSKKELQETFEQVSAYKDRLTKEFLFMAKKLRMSPEKIDSSLKKHSELINLGEILNRIESQIEGEN